MIRPARQGVNDVRIRPVSGQSRAGDTSAAMRWIRVAGADIARFGEARPLLSAWLPPITEAILGLRLRGGRASRADRGTRSSRRRLLPARVGTRARVRGNP